MNKRNNIEIFFQWDEKTQGGHVAGMFTREQFEEVYNLLKEFQQDNEELQPAKKVLGL